MNSEKLINNEHIIKEMKSLVFNKRKKVFYKTNIIPLVYLILWVSAEIFNMLDVQIVLGMTALFVFAYLAGLIYVFHINLTNAEYHSFPQTRDENGNHKCIVCGHSGIYRSRKNDTNIIVCSCTNCSHKLFYENN